MDIKCTGCACLYIPARQLLYALLKALPLVHKVREGRELKVKELADLAVLKLGRLQGTTG
jgi:hypothetical protein